jgi:hypothetical protein
MDEIDWPIRNGGVRDVLRTLLTALIRIVAHGHQLDGS